MNMKSLLKRITLFLSVAMLCAGCSEEFNGQFPVKTTPPAQVTLLPDGVANFPGGATITFQLPDETDLLYVKAVYQLPNGSIREEKVSSFSNSLTVRGFGRSKVARIQLISVDRSRNESQPVEVEIHPEDSPIYGIFESLDVNESWGGISLRWDNPLKENIVVSVLRRNDQNDCENIENFYSNAAKIRQAVRGLDPIMTEFEFYVRDMYGNQTDTLKAALQPWVEIMLDKKKFVAIPLASNLAISPYGSGNMSFMWDGRVALTTSNLFYINPGTVQPFFAINLGEKAKLSRFTYVGRTDYFFRLHHAKEIQMYGTNDPLVGNNPNSSNSDWILLNPEIFVSVRPSGENVSIPATGEDYDYAFAGEEFEFTLDVSAVQWVRFFQVSSWTGTNGLWCQEITFWGAVE